MTAVNNTILVLLGGGRGQWPNIWSVLAYSPDRVYVLPPLGDDNNTATLTKWLESRGVAGTILSAVAPYDREGAQEACASLIEEHPDARIMFNLTQAPKLMAIGAAYACIASRRPDVTALHRETSTGLTHAAWGELPETRQAAITVDDYLMAYGRKAFDTFYVEHLPCSIEHLVQLARNFASQLSEFNALVQWLRAPANSGARGGVRRAEPGPGFWSPGWAPLLKRMSEFGLVRHVVVNSDRGGFELASNHVWNFLNGTWLELYAVDEARKCVDPATGRPLFSDCRMSVAIDTDDVTNEIDLACIDSAGFLLYASCKTNQALRQDMLTEIVDRANLFGQSYCEKVFITNRSNSEVDAAIGLRDQAAARGVPIIAGERLPKLGELLVRAMV